jgi:hypothetical protein
MAKSWWGLARKGPFLAKSAKMLAKLNSIMRYVEQSKLVQWLIFQ